MFTLLTLKESLKESLYLTLTLSKIPLFIIMIFLMKLEIMHIKYLLSRYRKETHGKFLKVIKDKGLYGEYLSFRVLESLPGYKKILSNVYITKENNQTTEIDLIMIHETGIYVIESKNFSGWIFGCNSDKFWTQTLNGKRKNKFYNPIWQNENHIKYLDKYLDDNTLNYKSIIAFSERCTLKKIDNSSDTIVCNRNNLKSNLLKIIGNEKKVLDKNEIDKLYLELKECTNKSLEVKKEHINNIKNNKKVKINI